MLLLYSWQPATHRRIQHCRGLQAESQPRRSTTPAPRRIRSAPYPAPDAKFVIAHGLIPRVWTQTVAAQPATGETRSQPHQRPRRSPVKNREKVQHDRRCGRIDPACPVATPALPVGRERMLQSLKTKKRHPGHTWTTISRTKQWSRSPIRCHH